MRRFGVSARALSKHRLQQWEEHIGNYGERLVGSRGSGVVPPRRVGEPEQEQRVVGQIRHLLDARMEQHSSQPQLQQHFGELFSGLDSLTSPERSRHLISEARTTAQRLHAVLDPSHNEEHILRDFDEVYFHGLADFRFTTAILADSRVHNVSHLSRAVVGGGTILRWSRLERSLFQLHVANKLWRLGERTKAREYVSHAWSDLAPGVASDLDATVVRQLIRAGIVVAPDLISESLDEAAAAGRFFGIRGAYVTWSTARRMVGRKDMEELAQKAAEATGFAAALSLIPPGPLSSRLEFVPRKHHTDHQIAAVLNKYGHDLGDNRIGALAQQALTFQDPVRIKFSIE